MFRRINFLELLRFRVQPASDDRHDQSAKRREDFLLEVHYRDQPKLRIAQVNMRNAIADLLRFLLVLPRHDCDDGDVTIGSGKLLSIYIDKRERIDVSGTQLIRPHRRAGQNCGKEKIFKRASEHAQGR